jgi:AcrR family transcriptional regulator
MVLGVPRPRAHDLDELLGVTERLLAERGPERLTVRTLAAEAGVSNGAIYHAFGSLPALLARAWLRAATDFLRLQHDLTQPALTGASPVEAVVAAAQAPAVFAESRPVAAMMLLDVSRERLLGPALPDELADELIGLDRRLVTLLERLARAMWGRADGASVEVITTCVVDLPSALFIRALRTRATEASPIDHPTRERLAAAVRAILASGPPPRT